MLEPKEIKHGMRVTLDGASDYDKGLWHVLDRSPNGTRAAWYVHRWQTVRVFVDGVPTGDTETVWRSLTVEPREMSRALRPSSYPNDPMAYYQEIELELIGA